MCTNTQTRGTLAARVTASDTEPQIAGRRIKDTQESNKADRQLRRKERQSTQQREQREHADREAETICI